MQELYVDELRNRSITELDTMLFQPNDDQTITSDQVRKAAVLSEYFLQHALKAQNAISGPPTAPEHSTNCTPTTTP